MAELDGRFRQPESVTLTFGEPIEQASVTRVELRDSVQVGKRCFGYKVGEVVISSGKVRVEWGAGRMLPRLTVIALLWDLLWWLMLRARQSKRRA